jgi:hypothetical protein
VSCTFLGKLANNDGFRGSTFSLNGVSLSQPHSRLGVLGILGCQVGTQPAAWLEVGIPQEDCQPIAFANALLSAALEAISAHCNSRFLIFIDNVLYIFIILL